MGDPIVPHLLRILGTRCFVSLVNYFFLLYLKLQAELIWRGLNEQ